MENMEIFGEIKYITDGKRILFLFMSDIHTYEKISVISIQKNCFLIAIKLIIY